MEQSPLHATYIGDVHGSYRALEASLIASEEAEKRGSNLHLVKKGEVICLGDLIDRGSEHFAVFDLLLQLREELGDLFTAVIGNHEIALLRVRENPENHEILAQWLNAGGHTLLREVAETEPHLQKPTVQNFPLSYDGLEADQQQILHRWWKSFAQERQLEHLDLPVAFKKMLDWMQKRYKRIFEDMHVIHDRPGILAVHAGITKAWAERPLNDANELLRTCEQQGVYTPFVNEGEAYNLLNMRRREQPDKLLLTASTARALREKHKHVLFHGHDGRKNGVQEYYDAHGVLIVNTDTCMSYDYPVTPNNWAYTQRKPDGTIVVSSETGGVRRIARLREDGYETLE